MYSAMPVMPSHTNYSNSKHSKYDDIVITSSKANCLRMLVNVLQKDNQVVDILIDNTDAEGQFTFTGRAKILSPSNGQAWNASFTVKYSIDFNTGDLTYYKYQFSTECK